VLFIEINPNGNEDAEGIAADQSWVQKRYIGDVTGSCS